MIIGVPKEIKSCENRVAITPAGVQALFRRGHEIQIESGAGVDCGIANQDYQAAGAKMVPKKEVFNNSELIVKVKEPLSEEFDLFKEGQKLFTYLHLAREPELTNILLERKILSIAYETIQLDDRSLPLLTPMSEVAGRMSVQVGARFLEKPQGGKGILMGGVPGVPSADVVIIGGGIVGINAAKIAIGMGAQVTIIDKNPNRLRYLDDIFGVKIKTLISNSYNIESAVQYADLVVSGVLVPGAKAPHLVNEEMVRKMKQGSVIVDVAIDQGGSVETIDRVTTHDEPVYEKHGVLHYAVANIPGAVARTSTFALTNATLPYLLELAEKGCDAFKDNKALCKGINTIDGKITCRPVAEAHNTSYTPLDQVL
ncbi:MAG: alanine dehydrogenase [Clostridiales bacterium]|nr:alanine dehydrogenase [Clostridiales bacterium]MCF8022632.1 alanine dehydrogenase [Clostridiales bacterium]